MSFYKLAQFVSSFVENHRPGFFSFSMSTTQIHNNMIFDMETHDSASLSGAKVKTSSSIICPCTARLWLNKLGYRYIDIKKKVFFDSHERPDVVEDRHHFLTELEKLSPYLVEFHKEGSMVSKQYPADCAVNGPNC